MAQAIRVDTRIPADRRSGEPDPQLSAGLASHDATENLSPSQVLDLQQMAGNRAVGALISGHRRLVQRATADGLLSINGGNPTRVAGEAVGKGAQGGRNHSEQRLWTNQLEARVTGALEQGHSVEVTFVVDTTVCELCVPWFENTLYPLLQRSADDGGGQATLRVSVNGASVEIVGAATIWPPEITDAPTFDRMDETDRSMRFIREGRDESGQLGQQLGEYAGHEIAKLENLAETYATVGLTTEAIGTRLQEAKQQTATNPLIEAQFDTDAAGEPYTDWATTTLEKVTLSQIVRSGAFTLPDRPAAVSASAVNAWLSKVQEHFHMWLDDWIEEEEQFPRAVKSRY